MRGPQNPVVAVISEATRARLPELAAQFQRREPFRHVVIDDFLDRAAAERLLAEFPAFDPKYAMNENGEVGQKAVVERIRAVGPSYAALDDLIQTREFLALLSRITGIDDLRYDPDYFGGGTHENREGQDLDAHVDFNRHPVTHTHRRLNLIVYLNHEWDDAWGGSLELHSDPRSEDDRVTRVTPLFNRAVIFETTEWSWHGFSRITLPEAKRALSRKSIALYFYTEERPTEELADTHSTIYVDRPLPERFVAGRTLDGDDVQELKVLLKRRDMHIERLYRDVQNVQAQFEHLQRQIGLIRGSRVYRALVFLRRLVRGG
jgi:hypothetical protein